MTLPPDIAGEMLALERWIEAQPKPWHIPWEPNSRQREFLGLMCREALYGGAAGGGKSGALLMAALQYVHVPGYSAILFRRTFKQLQGADGLIEKSHELLDGTGAVWTKSDYLWTFPSGATMRFGHIEGLGDEKQYDGHAFQFCGFDELTHFLEQQYRHLFSRQRRPKRDDTTPLPPPHLCRELCDVPLRMRGATNPGGIGHEWVQKRFAISTTGTQAEKWTEKQGERVVEVHAKHRTFVPAKVEDNAANLDVDSYKESSLSQLDATQRAQLEEGLWIRDGQGLIYKHVDAPAPHGNLIDGIDLDEPWTYLLSIDLGASQSTPTTAFAIIAYHEHRNETVAVRSWAEAGMTPKKDADRIAEVFDEFPLELVVVDTGGLGGGYLEDFQVRFGEVCIAAEKKNKLGARRILNGMLERRELLIVADQNADLRKELGTLPWDERGLDAEKGFADHLTDALLYGARASRGFAAVAPAKRPAHGTPEWSAEEERRMEDALDAQLQRSAERAWWDDGAD